VRLYIENLEYILDDGILEEIIKVFHRDGIKISRTTLAINARQIN